MSLHASNEPSTILAGLPWLRALVAVAVFASLAVAAVAQVMVLPAGRIGTAYSYQVVTNAPAGAVFGANGLPPGVSINASSGLISGVPTAAGGFGGHLTLQSQHSYSTVVYSFSVFSSIPPSVAITSPTPGAMVTVGATPAASVDVTAVATDADGTVVSVQFFANSLPIGSDVSAPYTTTFTPPSPGTYALAAVAIDSSGDTVWSAPVHLTAVPPPAPVVAITSPAAGSAWPVNVPQPIAATVTHAAGRSIAAVSFFANGTLIGTDTTLPYQVNWTPSFAGAYTLTAVATDDIGIPGTSSGVGVEVEPGPPPSVALTSLDANTNLVAGTAQILTAQAAPFPPASILQVQFLVDGVVVGVDTTAPYSVHWTPPAARSFTVTARATDSFGGSAVSAPVTLVAAVSVAITTQPLSKVVAAGAAATFTVGATGAGALTYQWHRNGFPISGATGATFTIAAAARSDVDSYAVRVSDGYSIRHSNPAGLDVVPAATAAILRLDADFGAAVERGGGAAYAIRPLPSGKLLVAGKFVRINGVARRNLARLNADGTVDASFVPAYFDEELRDVAVQPDGKVIVVGMFNRVDGITRNRIARLEANGALDLSYNIGTPFLFPSVVVVQADGKAIIGGNFSALLSGILRHHLARINADGTLDVDYNPSPNLEVRSLSLLPDGRLLIGGAFTTIGGVAQPYFARLLGSGMRDPAFTPGTGPNAATELVQTLTDGRALVGGVFSAFSGTTCQGLIRVLADGSRDPSFSGLTALGGANSVVVQADGKVVVGGSFSTVNGVARPRVARLLADGSLDADFIPAGEQSLAVRSLALLGDGRVLAGGVYGSLDFTQLHAGLAALDGQTGSVDSSFTGLREEGSVTALAHVSGNKVIVAGSFSAVNGSSTPSIARLHSDGSVDATFTPGAGANRAINAVAVQGDGRLLIGGAFTTYNGETRQGVARLHADGTLDSTFNPGLGANGNLVSHVISLSEGRALVAGTFISFAGQPRIRLVRLLANGSVDATFVPFASAPAQELNFTLTDVVALPDGRVVYANDGNVSSNGLKARTLGRFNVDGTLDDTFGAGARPNAGVLDLALLPDGKILIGGTFTAYGAAARNRLARLHADGTLDSSFDAALPGTEPLWGLWSRADGAIFLLRGNYTFTQPTTPTWARVTAAGAIDGSFAATFSSLASQAPRALLLEDGNLLLGGGSFREDAKVRTGLMRTTAQVAPSILAEPVAVRANAGAEVSFSVAVGGAESPAYQWFKDNVLLPGAVGATLVIPAAQLEAAGSYFVRITHAGGQLDSAAVPLTLTESAPVFRDAAGAPVGFGPTLPAGKRFALNAPALAAGSSPLTYQWSKDGVNIPGATGSALFRASWQPSDGGVYRVTVANSLGTITSGEYFQPVAATPDWSWVRPVPLGNSLTAIAFLNGRFLAGSNRDEILTSADGLTWTAQDVPSAVGLGPFAFGNGTYVVLAGAAGILSSADGETWTPRESGVVDGQGLNAMAFGAGRFVAVGPRGIVVTSTDGMTWAATALPDAGRLRAVAFGGGRWLAISDGNRAYHSTDGLTWTAGGYLPEPAAFLAFGAGLFATTSTGANAVACTSPDGVVWTRRPYAASNTAATRGLQHSSVGFLAPLSTTAGRYLFSADGVAWTERAVDFLMNNVPTSIAFGAGRYVMAAAAPELLLTSTNGTSWSRVMPSESRGFRAIATGATVAVAVGVGVPGLGTASAGLVHTSADGERWTPRSIATLSTLYDVVFGFAPGALFVAVGSEGTIATSSDGVAWSLRSSGTTNTLRGVRQLGSHFRVVGDGGTMLKSNDGTTWTSVTTGTAEALHEVAGNGLTLVAVGANGTVLVSTDGTAGNAWTAKTSGVSSSLVGVVQATGKFVAASSTGEIITSVDGQAWTRRANLSIGLNGLVYAGRQFLALGVGSGYAISPDGENWTHAQHGSALPLYDAVEFKSTLLAVGNAGSILAARLPVLTVEPGMQFPAIGDTVTLNVGIGVVEPVTYQWLKDGVAIAGATNAAFTLVNVTTADSGQYLAVVSNARGGVASKAVNVGVIPANTAAAHELVESGYTPGDTLTVENTLAHSGPITVLAWSVLLPSGWSFVSSSGDAAAVSPAPGTTHLAEWAWIGAPANPVRFSYTLRVPENQSGRHELVALAILRSGGSAVVQVLAKPDPLRVLPAHVHSMDSDGDFQLSLFELTRVIELYNTRNGTVRTGAYRVDAANLEDGFGADTPRAPGAAAVLTRYHSADTRGAATGSPRDGAIDLFELTRVIELYNTRAGTVRTGRYHVLQGTEDGFAAEP